MRAIVSACMRCSRAFAHNENEKNKIITMNITSIIANIHNNNIVCVCVYGAKHDVHTLSVDSHLCKQLQRYIYLRRTRHEQ